MGCQAGKRNRRLFLLFLLQLMHMSAPLSRMDRTFAFKKGVNNEIDLNLANARLRFKCLEI